uniref:Photosystem I assembly protein Ycf4 n=1 Tax=Neogoniolithon spectabile TaxID=231755 RepID=A0A3G3MGY4_9FLOR|nr:photosystem I assembly protein Ycf4 [Neogoniolithon spectabile]AYR06094.1 photosystem I assembly protein Ycf4 [Neogoniolithon spectabile]
MLIKVKKDRILGSRRFDNYCWATITTFGSLSFFIVGISSYFNKNLLPFLHAENIIFIPQGVVMVFYGMLGLSLSLFLWLTIIWDVGAGYNQFDISQGTITIFRLGFPGKNRFLSFKYNVRDIQSIKVSIKEGITPKREIYLKIKDNREIPLTRVGRPLLLSEIEDKAIDLAKFLSISVEGID